MEETVTRILEGNSERYMEVSCSLFHLFFSLILSSIRRSFARHVNDSCYYA